MKKIILVFTFMFLWSSTATLQAAPPAGPMAAGDESTAETEQLKGTSADIGGTFRVPLPLPGGNRDSIFTLARDGTTISGSITNPYKPDEKCEIYNGTVKNNTFSFYANVGGTEFNFQGTAGNGKLSMTFTTLESITLEDGLKIKTSKEAAIDGVYLVPVYSPGGPMENIFFIKTEGDILKGQMVSVNNPTGDRSDFFDGTVDGGQLSFYTRTAQGSLFHFMGTVDGDKIKLNMMVTDVSTNVKGSAI